MGSKLGLKSDFESSNMDSVPSSADISYDAAPLDSVSESDDEEVSPMLNGTVYRAEPGESEVLR